MTGSAPLDQIEHLVYTYIIVLHHSIAQAIVRHYQTMILMVYPNHSIVIIWANKSSPQLPAALHLALCNITDYIRLLEDTSSRSCEAMHWLEDVITPLITLLVVNWYYCLQAMTYVVLCVPQTSTSVTERAYALTKCLSVSSCTIFAACWSMDMDRGLTLSIFSKQRAAVCFTALWVFL